LLCAFHVGVSSAERAATLEEIDRKQVNLIITSDEVMTNEKYEPLKDYINRTFKTATHFGDVLILEW
jgi:ribosomal protein RSM22 (predicted rRNA methylase)